MASRTSIGRMPSAGGGHRPEFRPSEVTGTPPGPNQGSNRLSWPARLRKFFASISLSSFLSLTLPSSLSHGKGKELISCRRNEDDGKEASASSFKGDADSSDQGIRESDCYAEI